MLSLFVTLGVGLLLTLLPVGAEAAQPTQGAKKPATKAVWVMPAGKSSAPVQTVRWTRWRGNRWGYSQGYTQSPTYCPVCPPANTHASKPAPQPAQAQAAPVKPAPAQAAQPVTPQAAPAKPLVVQPAPPVTGQAATKPATPAQPMTPAQQLELHAVEQRVIEHTNSQRARYGLRPLRVDLGLIGSARRHTQWMTRNHTLQHTSIGVAENIAMGQNSPTEVLNAWMNSSGHRANILNSGYTRIGVAAYRTPQGTTYWCQQFLR
jgi:uncharacterized protein YkwD